MRSMAWVLLLAGCAFGQGCGRDADLTFMTGGAPHEFAFYQELCRDFEQTTGIPVTLIRSATQTEQRKQQIIAGLRGGEPDPDLFLMDIALIKYGYDQPPETWPDLLAMAKAVQVGERASRPDFFGFVWQGAQYAGLVCNVLEFFTPAGGGFVDAHNRPVLDSDANVARLGPHGGGGRLCPLSDLV